MEMSRIEILGLIVLPFVALMSGVAILYNKLMHNLERSHKRKKPS